MRHGCGEMMGEVPLNAGRVTEGIVRIGNTLRRPRKPNSLFVRDLLAYLSEQGFDAAPSFLGTDEYGREIFSFQPGEVPGDLDPTISDATLAAAARLIRRYHKATVGSPLAGREETVCHNDLSPCNFVFRYGVPVGIIDFDTAAPGKRLHDIGYAIFLWLNLGTDGPASIEQARRIKIFCDAYGIAADDQLIEAIVEAVSTNIERLKAEGRRPDVEWWQGQLDWLVAHGSQLTRPGLVGGSLNCHNRH
jgi:phosphotransferase family enzyme